MKYIKEEIASANSKKLLLINFELLFNFLKEKEIEKARKSIKQLLYTLDFKYEISNDLMKIYFYADKLLVKYQINKNEELIDQAKRVLKPIKESFEEICREENIRYVKTITYGDNNIEEIIEKREYC